MLFYLHTDSAPLYSQRKGRSREEGKLSLDICFMSTSPCVLPDTLNIDGTEMNVEGNFGITLFWDHLRPLERLLSSMLRE